jgi:hypothetical protein
MMQRNHRLERLPEDGHIAPRVDGRIAGEAHFAGATAGTHRTRHKEFTGMRLLAPIGILLLVSGCQYASSPFDGFGGFVSDTHTPYRNPNRPVGDSDNMRRVMGEESTAAPLLPEPGNVWPGPLPPAMTLQDVQRSNDQDILKPGEEMNLRGQRGSSTPPGTLQQQPIQNGQRIQPAPQTTPSYVQPAPRDPTIQTPSGPAALGRNGAVQTYTDPRGNTGIVIPNGNGTSTLVAPDGSVQTVPSPR